MINQEIPSKNMMLHCRNFHTPLKVRATGLNSVTSLVLKPNYHNSVSLLPTKTSDQVLKSSCLSDVTRSQPLVDRNQREEEESTKDKMSVRCRGSSKSSQNWTSPEEESGRRRGVRETTTKVSEKIKGSVVLMKKNVLDFNDFNASILDRVHELFGQRVTLQLVSAVNGDPGETR